MCQWVPCLQAVRVGVCSCCMSLPATVDFRLLVHERKMGKWNRPIKIADDIDTAILIGQFGFPFYVNGTSNLKSMVPLCSLVAHLGFEHWMLGLDWDFLGCDVTFSSAEVALCVMPSLCVGLLCLCVTHRKYMIDHEPRFSFLKEETAKFPDVVGKMEEEEPEKKKRGRWDVWWEHTCVQHQKVLKLGI